MAREGSALTEPHAMLGRAIAGLQSKMLPDDCRRWLLDGLFAYRLGDAPLDVCLDLHPGIGKSSDSPPTSWKFAKRDRLIIDMAAALPGNDPWPKAGIIADFLAERPTESLPPRAAGIGGHIFALPVRKVTSQRQVHRILTTSRSD